MVSLPDHLAGYAEEMIESARAITKLAEDFEKRLEALEEARMKISGMIILDGAWLRSLASLLMEKGLITKEELEDKVEQMKGELFDGE